MYKNKWSQSYKRTENYLFYPHEEVVRFISKNVRRRVGLNDYEDIREYDDVPHCLALGCGTGRHVIFAHDMGFDAYGIDLSDEAVSFAQRWAGERGLPQPESRILQGSLEDLPWDDGFFDVIVSHGVLDSMPFDTACASVEEACRVLRSDGLFYCDLISGDDSEHAREYFGEEEIDTEFEEGTIQSYFNYCKINQLFGGLFNTKKLFLIRRENIEEGSYRSRYHITLEKAQK